MAKKSEKQWKRPGFERVGIDVPEELYIKWLKFLNKKFKKRTERIIEHIIRDVEEYEAIVKQNQ